MTASTETVRDALVSYARDWNTGALDRRQSEVQALLEACRPDRSPMWRWATFELVATAVQLADAMPSDTGRATARDRLLDDLTGEGL